MRQPARWRSTRYPYGCAEQVSSRALPLLYLNDVAASLGLGTDDALKQRIKDAIADLLTHQTSTGGFGLWGPFDTSDLWLDSYVTDFLLRAKAKRLCGAGSGDEQRARQPRQPGVGGARLRQGWRGPGLRALRPGARRPGGDR